MAQFMLLRQMLHFLMGDAAFKAMQRQGLIPEQTQAKGQVETKGRSSDKQRAVAILAQAASTPHLPTWLN